MTKFVERSFSRKHLFAAALALAALLALSTLTQSKAEFDGKKPRKVLMISVDAFRPDFYTSSEYEAATLKDLAKTGASATGMESVFPTVTYPNHTSLVTGVQTGKHGVLSNSLFDWVKGPQPGWYWESEKIKARTLWQAATDAGKTSASVHWPVTVGATMTWLVPEIFNMKGYYEGTDWEVLKKVTKADLLQEIEAAGVKPYAALDRDSDRWGAEAAAVVLKNHSPDLMLLHIIEADHAQHSVGRDGPEVKEAVKYVDSLIATVLQSVDRDSTCVLIVGDHGFYNITKSVGVNKLFVDAGWITLDANKAISSWKVIAQQAGGQAAIYVKDKALVPAVRELLKKNESIGYNLVERADLDKLGAYPEAALAVEGKPGFTIGSSPTELVKALGKTQGNHGYLPSHPELRTGFIASGCGIPAGKQLGLVRVIDIAPTVAKLLGLSLPQTDGKALDLGLTAKP